MTTSFDHPETTRVVEQDEQHLAKDSVDQPSAVVAEPQAPDPVINAETPTPNAQIKVPAVQSLVSKIKRGDSTFDLQDSNEAKDIDRARALVRVGDIPGAFDGRRYDLVQAWRNTAQSDFDTRELLRDAGFDDAEIKRAQALTTKPVRRQKIRRFSFR